LYGKNNLLFIQQPIESISASALKSEDMTTHN